MLTLFPRQICRRLAEPISQSGWQRWQQVIIFKGSLQGQAQPQVLHWWRAHMWHVVCDFGVLCRAPSVPDQSVVCTHAMPWKRVSRTIMSVARIGLSYPGISETQRQWQRTESGHAQRLIGRFLAMNSTTAHVITDQRARREKPDVARLPRA